MLYVRSYTVLESQFEVVSVEASQCPLEKNKCLFKRGSEPRIRIGFKPGMCIIKRFPVNGKCNAREQFRNYKHFLKTVTSRS